MDVDRPAPGRPDPSEPDPPWRHLPLEGAFNFRDAGGYRTADGNEVRRRLLWRADGLSRLTDSDRARLQELGLRTVVDLRSGPEVDSHGRIAWPEGAFDYHNFPLLDVLPPPEEYARSWTSPAHVAGQYLTMVDDGRAAMGPALALLGDAARYPLVVHCAAGKDRTGIVVAAALGMAGVSDDDIVADYVLSAAAMTRMLEWLRVARPEQAERVSIRAPALMSAEPETMRLFVTGVRDRHGSWEGLAAHLGQPDLPGRIRSVLVAAPV